jgi:beta-glucosidase
MMDMTPESLTPSPGTLALLEKIDGNFENLIVVVNAGNAMQLGFLEDYPSVKAVLWMGTPGPYGCRSLAETLAGQLNPSGRLVDSYAYDVTSAPAAENLGDYDYDNIKGMSFLNYEEGVYVGYRYYETRYLGDEQGYAEVIQYPFGYGLSYTDFAWEIAGTDFGAERITLDVKVTNTGSVAGKDVVQVYFGAPWTAGGIEKPARVLGGYAKTGLLAPGESETVNISFAVRDMASYDAQSAKAYVLDAGEYEIALSKDVHTPVETLHYTVAETAVFAADSATGAEITNRFDYAEGGLRYLSRSDWSGTYPDESRRVFTAPEDVVLEFEWEPAVVEGELPVMGADNGLVLADLRGLPYDDPKWESFLDQFTFEEMRDLFADAAYKTVAIERFGMPSTVLLDGPAGISAFFAETDAAAYPTEVVIASTWNDELAYAVGDSVGKEAVAYGVTGWYAPAMNVHRTAMGGRNFEYFSEDPLLSGKMAAAMVRGAQAHGVIGFIKHFALNEQEVNARTRVSVWVNEQAMREVYLRSFEIAVKESDPSGAMSSFIFIGPKWSGGNPELLQDVLRTEWGFDGLVTTDAVVGGFMDDNLALRSGNDLMLDVAMVSMNRKYINRLYKEDPVGVATGLRERAHTVCYVVLNDTSLVG